MKLKQKPGDFRVREVLRDDFVVQRGPNRVYLVKKRKLTSLEAASALASMTGVRPGDVSMAGLKDRQGITEQMMTVPRGKPIMYRRPELSIESIGSSAQPISSNDALGNQFDIIVRKLGPLDVRHVRAALPIVREHGLPNYFDEQRFGNLRHGQGWIALELAQGRVEDGLKRLLTALSQFDNEEMKTFKTGLYRNWGKWGNCRDIAGRFGAHHSVFEHLKRNDGDFAGAFGFISSRIRLIHLFAYQSHVWNRALAKVVEGNLDRNDTIGIASAEGRLIFPKQAFSGPAAWGGMLPLPGPGLEGVTHADQRALFTEVLRPDKLEPEGFRIDGVPGFALKAEDRSMMVVPRDLRIRSKHSDSDGEGAIELSFGLPRGSYATLVVRRLIGSTNRSTNPLGRPSKSFKGRRDSRDNRGGRGRPDPRS
ncbi:MAG: tRNA pseudouridine13 synthase [Chlamydiales bacterium]|jgi:tRNA pseudouridine13 synthase